MDSTHEKTLRNKVHARFENFVHTSWAFWFDFTDFQENMYWCLQYVFVLAWLESHSFPNVPFCAHKLPFGWWWSNTLKVSRSDHLTFINSAAPRLRGSSRWSSLAAFSHFRCSSSLTHTSVLALLLESSLLLILRVYSRSSCADDGSTASRDAGCRFSPDPRRDDTSEWRSRLPFVGRTPWPSV